MSIWLERLRPEFEPEIYEMVQEIGKGENGFGNSVLADGPAEFLSVLELNDDYANGLRLPKGCVPQTIYWLRDGGRPVGYGKLRPQLNAQLELHGGHIGYTIRPSERGKGYGTLLLMELLKEARLRGLREVLLTCKETNTPSRKVMEKNNGHLIDNLNGRCRYAIRIDI